MGMYPVYQVFVYQMATMMGKVRAMPRKMLKVTRNGEMRGCWLVEMTFQSKVGKGLRPKPACVPALAARITLSGAIHDILRTKTQSGHEGKVVIQNIPGEVREERCNVVGEPEVHKHTKKCVEEETHLGYLPAVCNRILFSME